MAKATKIATKTAQNASRSTAAADKTAQANEGITPPTATGTLGDGYTAAPLEAQGDPTGGVKPEVGALLAKNQGSAFTAEERAVPPAPMPELDHPDFRPTPGQKTKPMTVMLVMIKRGLEEIPAECFKHELPLLRAIHLPENVKVLDPEYSEVDIPNSSGAEWARLQNKYKQHQDKLASVLRGPEDIADRAGLADDTDDFGETPQAVVETNRRKPAARK